MSDPCAKVLVVVTRTPRWRRQPGVAIIATPREPLGITVSKGGEALAAGSKGLDALLAQANRQIDAASRGGRNRVRASADRTAATAA